MRNIGRVFALFAAIPVMGQTGVSILPADPTPQFRLQGISSDNWTVYDVSGQPFTRVWRLKTPYPAASGNPYDFFLTGHAQQAITQGDLLVATVWIRSISAAYGNAYTRFVVQEDQPPYAKSAEWFLSSGSDWKQFQIPFRAVKTNAADSYSIQFWISSGPQEIEIAGLQILNYGPSLRVKDLSLSNYPYEGFAAKTWLPAAEARIEKFRKGNAVVVIRDDNGHPIPNASIDIHMKSHQFGFGTAVASTFLLGTDANSAIYRRTLQDNFNRATPEDELKWPSWLGSRDSALKSLAWLKANGFKQVRGHNLVWPGWQYLPAYLQGFASNASGLEAEIEKHIHDEASATAGQLSEWDVINEPVTNQDLQKILGQPIMAKWFQAVRQNEPAAKLYVNDYNLLEGGGNDTPHQAGLETVLQTLDANAAGVQGIGLQAHFQWQLTDPARLYDVISRFAAYKHEMQVTELDVDVEDPALQAQYLTDFLTICFSHPSISGTTLWGFWEGRHFRPNAALWNLDWTLKPAARAWRNLVYSKWWTQLKAQSDADGVVRFRGFGGTYEAVATINGKQQVLNFTLTAGKTNYISLGKAPTPKLGANGIVNGASFTAGAVSPGEVIAIFGTDFGGSGVTDDVAILVDGNPLAVPYSVEGQAGAVLPLSIRGVTTIQLEYLGLPSNEVYLPVADASPGIFTQSGGAGQAVVLNSTGQLNSPSSPAARGETVSFFATGLGAPDAAGSPPVQPRVLFGRQTGELQSVGWVLPGVYELTARIPSGSPIGEAVSLTLDSGNFQSQPGPTLAIR
jgi:uncharacterized protein (TIGR03437 family)